MTVPAERLTGPFRGFLRDFAVHGALLFLSAIAGNIGSYLLYVVASRLLNVAAYGDFYALITATGLVGVLAASGTTAVAKNTAVLIAKRDDAGLSGFLRWVVRGSILLATLVGIGGIAASAIVAEVLHLQSPIEVIACSGVIAASLVAPTYRGVLQGAQRFSSLSLSFGGEGLLRAGFSIAAILLGLGVTGALLGQLLGIAAATLYGAVLVHRSHDTTQSQRFSPDRQLVESIAGSTLATLGIAMLATLDILVVKHFVSSNDAGVYGALALCGRIVFFLSTFVPVLIIPKVARLSTEAISTRHILLKALALAAAICTPATVLFAMYPAIALRTLTGSHFLAAAPYLGRYGLAMGFLGLTNIVASYQIAKHQFGFIAPVILAAACEAVALVLWHRDLNQIVTTVLGGQILAFVASTLPLLRSRFRVSLVR